jgi:hypothetical protein
MLVMVVSAVKRDLASWWKGSDETSSNGPAFTHFGKGSSWAARASVVVETK